jgi:NADPH:quinone reductase-like Zn-dependent oxidoreductase
VTAGLLDLSELAARSGVPAQRLHHYAEVGLLPPASTDGHLGRAHQPAKAYTVLCPEERASLSEEAWANQTLMVDRYDFVGVHLDQSGGGSQATVDVGVTNTTGRKVERQLTVVKENGRWWVCDQ